MSLVPTCALEKPGSHLFRARTRFDSSTASLSHGSSSRLVSQQHCIQSVKAKQSTWGVSEDDLVGLLVIPQVLRLLYLGRGRFVREHNLQVLFKIRWSSARSRDDGSEKAHFKSIFRVQSTWGQIKCGPAGRSWLDTCYDVAKISSHIMSRLYREFETHPTVDHQIREANV